MSHLSIEIKKSCLCLHLVLMVEEVVAKAQSGSLLPHEVYVGMSCLSMMSHDMLQ